MVDEPIIKIEEIDFDFMELFIRELSAYLTVSGLSDTKLSDSEEAVLLHFKNLDWKEFRFDEIFNHIEQGRRLKKNDQNPGPIPFVMSGITNTGTYWNDEKEYTKGNMLFFATSVAKSLVGKYSYGHKLRSSQSFGFKMYLPVKGDSPDYDTMETFISAVQKLVIKDVVQYANKKIEATKKVINTIPQFYNEFNVAEPEPPYGENHGK